MTQVLFNITCLIIMIVFLCFAFTLEDASQGNLHASLSIVFGAILLHHLPSNTYKNHE